MGDIYETPIDFFRPGAAGPKFSMPKDTKNLKPNYNLSSNIIAKALVVEYNSNTIFSLSYEDVRDFYLKVIFIVSHILDKFNIIYNYLK